MTQATVQDVLSGSMDMIGTPEFQGIIESIDQAELKTAIKALDYRREFLATPYWKHVAKLVKERDGHECRLCCSKTKPAAHHRSYRYHGEEHRHMEDLVTLCEACHQKHHDILPFPERYPEAPPATIAKEVDLANPDQLVLVTKEMARSLVGRKNQWHWLKDHGYDPDKKGWRKRLIGQMAPAEFFQQSMPKKRKVHVIEGMPALEWMQFTVRTYAGHDVREQFGPALFRCLEAVGPFGFEMAARTIGGGLHHNAPQEDVVVAMEAAVAAQAPGAKSDLSADIISSMIAGRFALMDPDYHTVHATVETMMKSGFSFGHFKAVLRSTESFIAFLEQSGMVGHRLMWRDVASPLIRQAASE